MTLSPWSHAGCPGNGAVKSPILLIELVEAPGVPPVPARVLYEESVERSGGAGSGAPTR
jgi:hypothetical protein